MFLGPAPPPLSRHRAPRTGDDATARVITRLVIAYGCGYVGMFVVLEAYDNYFAIEKWWRGK